jgi:hypothetical protein
MKRRFNRRERRERRDQNFLISVLSVLCVLCGSFSGAAADEPSDGGAVISVQVGDGGATTIDVTRGELKVRAGGQETRVAAGESVRGERGQPLQPLLRAPRGLSPADGATLPTLEFTMRFDPVPRASGYQIIVAEDARFAQVVWRSDRTSATKTAARVAKAGVYFWRVVAVDDKNQAVGRPSPPRKLVIDTTPPKLKAGQPRWK